MFHGISFLFLQTIGEKAREDILSLRHASWFGVKAISDFFISINEHPHIKLKIMTSHQGFKNDFSEFINANKTSLKML